MKKTAPLSIAAVFLAILAPFASAQPTDDLSRFVTEVETLRGLRFIHPVEHKRLARADLRAFLEKQIETELPVPVDTYMATLEALHLVDSSASVDSMLDLYDAQVLAFYDPVTHVYYSIDEPPADIELPETLVDAVVVHELVHALQDQRFEAGEKTLDAQTNWDAALAYQSVLEGEALLVMMGYLGESMGATLEDLARQETFVDAVRRSAAEGVNVPAGIPDYFVESLKFPYVEGLAFVVDAYLRGGWDAVDAIHHDPPRSTEELIHPEVYRKRVEGSEKPASQAFSEPTDRLVETTLGEFHWSFLLGARAGEGWASDVVSVRHAKNGATVLIDSSWDDEKEAVEFETAIRSFVKENELPNGSVTRDGARVKAAWGTDTDVVRVFASITRSAAAE